MHLFTIPPWINYSYFAAAALIILWRGDGRARAICAGVGVSIAASAYACRTWSCWGAGSPPLMAWRGLSEDVPVLMICLACAWRAERYWVLWASSFALLSLVTDLLTLTLGVTPWANGSASIVWTQGLTTTLLVGVWSGRPRARPASAPPIASRGRATS
jgi:hypothetical protein